MLAEKLFELLFTLKRERKKNDESLITVVLGED